VGGRVWIVLIVAVLAIVGIGAVNNSRPNSNPSASTGATVNVLASTRSITVSPGAVTFNHCSGGTPDNVSTATRLGWPHATCSVGRLKDHGALPITIKNTGTRATIQVSASNANPSGSGPPWQLCGPGGNACTADSQPGANQFEAWTIAKGMQRAPLTPDAKCDVDFSAATRCAAARGQSGSEGIDLLGPEIFNSTSTSYTITITWMAAPPGS
jgi:hypothetical protein